MDARPPAFLRGGNPLLVVVANVGPAGWDRRMVAACEDLLRQIGGTRVDLWQLDCCDRERIKAGEPFRRVQELRDGGLIRFVGIVVQTPRDARWVLDNTPVHAITLDGPVDDADWSEVWPAACESGIGLLATARAAGHDLARARGLLAATPIAGFAWPFDLGP
ncbi:MAG: hypothetical protein HY718_19080 [Planctomycetes bacterium]|nr:hypothetical protein [Planctomycetota bacterium]